MIKILKMKDDSLDLWHNIQDISGNLFFFLVSNNNFTKERRIYEYV